MRHKHFLWKKTFKSAEDFVIHQAAAPLSHPLRKTYYKHKTLEGGMVEVTCHEGRMVSARPA
jgi:hypothetical protein